MYTYIKGSDHSVTITLVNFVAKSRQKQQLIAGSLKSSGGVSTVCAYVVFSVHFLVNSTVN